MKKNTISLRISLKFMIVLTCAVLILSCAIVCLIYFFVRTEQNKELESSAMRIERLLADYKNPPEQREKRSAPSAPKNNESTQPENTNTGSEKNRRPPAKRSAPVQPLDFSRIPYYVSYVVASSESDFSEVVFTNDPFLPVLPETGSRAKTYIAKDFFIDGNLAILYFSKKTGDGKYLIQVSLDMERDISSHLLDKIPPAIAIAVLPILLVSFFISRLIAKNTMAPVVRLTKSADKISSSNLGTLLPRSGNGDEIDNLASTFNSLFERLKSDFDREKSFTSDVSHELKTPVAVIMGQSNLLLRWGKDDPVQLQKSLESIKSEAKSMNAIITNLLEISRLENGLVKPSVSSVDIKEMFMRISEEFHAVSPSVVFEIPEKESAVIETDSELLHQVLTVVVSNSVKFSGDSCRIKLGWETSGNSMKIFSEDDGPGFSDDVLPHVFQRFYRGDEAHVRSSGGAGLGLSIAETIVECLGGKICAYNCSPHGAGISMEFNI